MPTRVLLYWLIIAISCQQALASMALPGQLPVSSPADQLELTDRVTVKSKNSTDPAPESKALHSAERQSHCHSANPAADSEINADDASVLNAHHPSDADQGCCQSDCKNCASHCGLQTLIGAPGLYFKQTFSHQPRDFLGQLASRPLATPLRPPIFS